ncbi:MAG TPA: response regulator [Anaeromyxobacteraceae bacterium]|nr:response regulator [Anaeromyxobacteraceae bacterium]
MSGHAFGVLVVEDDVDLASLMALVLSDAGYRVRTAPEGGAALQRVAEEMPGLILLDMRMPGMNGWEFARQFRARHGRAAPIVVVTAAENARARAAEVEAEGWLAKPFEIDEVLRMVAGHAAAAGQASAPAET